jgi:HTH-type transcriptional regulator/antitoxin HipB
MKNKNEVVIVHDLSELNVPHEYYSISMPKIEISKAIKNAIDIQNTSIRELAKKINKKHNQIVRITSGENYTIENLLTILDGLDLEIEIKPKK